VGGGRWEIGGEIGGLGDWEIGGEIGGLGDWEGVLRVSTVVEVGLGWGGLVRKGREEYRRSACEYDFIKDWLNGAN